MPIDEQRCRYQRSDGTPVWLSFKPDFPCIYCDQPIGEMSLGGFAVCPTCDCGISRTTGQPWTPDEYQKLVANARRKIDEMPDDPVWQEYEAEWRMTMDDSPIYREEMHKMFGDELPIEAVDLVFNAPDDMTVGELRQKLRKLAENYHAGLLLHEQFPGC